MKAEDKRQKAKARATRRHTVGAAPGAILLLLTAGCMNPELETYYGQHRIPPLSASVNGTDVLADMFRDAGYEVYFRRTLVTDQMQAADVIVWFPNDYRAPKDEACEWFDNWLYERSGRTLVYVGRDFDAAPLYWKQMISRVGVDQQPAYRRRQAAANFDARRPANLSRADLACPWFTFQPEDSREISQLSGTWAAGIDAAKAQIQLGTKVVPARRARPLLASGNDLLAARFSFRDWDQSQVLLVANGSFLLNLPLVNHENRKLAGKLIASVGEPGRVVFLESGSGGPSIDPAHTENSLWTLLGAWPLNVVLLQLSAVGVIFCFARWPIFGRPRQEAAEPTSDFAMHVSAVGELLARAKDRAFAEGRVSQVDGHAVMTAERKPIAAGTPSHARRRPLPPDEPRRTYR